MATARNMMMSALLFGALLIAGASAQAQTMSGRQRPSTSNSRPGSVSRPASGDRHSAAPTTSGSRSMTSRERPATTQPSTHPSGGSQVTRPTTTGGGGTVTRPVGGSQVSRPTTGGSRPSTGGNSSGTRPDNRGNGGTVTTRPYGGGYDRTRPIGGNKNDRGNVSGTRPGDRGNGGTRPDDRGNSGNGYYRGGSGHHRGGGDYRPGGSGYHYGGGHHGGDRRPPMPSSRGHEAYRGHYSWNYAHHDWSRPLPPPVRPYRPLPLHYRRPPMPTYYRPLYGAPVIDRILGITFGTLFNASLDLLYTGGYIIDGYESGVVYLRDVNMVSLVWPDAMMCYDTAGRLANAQFIYSAPYNDRTRYNRVYHDLCNIYGTPITVSNSVYLAEATWFGGNATGYVTLTLNHDGGRYFTTLSVGY